METGIVDAVQVVNDAVSATTGDVAVAPAVKGEAIVIDAGAAAVGITIAASSGVGAVVQPPVAAELDPATVIVAAIAIAIIALVDKPSNGLNRQDTLRF